MDLDCLAMASHRRLKSPLPPPTQHMKIKLYVRAKEGFRNLIIHKRKDCNSSMVLSLVEEDIDGVATRRPLFVGDVLMDAGAETSPLFPLNSCLFRGFKLPENE
ncbi:hypothetical protein SDJN02_01440, partial [Cucurbita argyrosperma subsp. argyrosperma]